MSVEQKYTQEGLYIGGIPQQEYHAREGGQLYHEVIYKVRMTQDCDARPVEPKATEPIAVTEIPNKQ